MAFPILLNVRHVEVPENKNPNKLYLAISNFSSVDSGILFECDFDKSYDLPWGITINQVKGGELGFFSNLSVEKLQLFSSALSTLLNGYYGVDSTNKVISLEPKSVVKELAEQVYTFSETKATEGLYVSLLPIGVSQIDLFKKAPSELEFFSQIPAHVTDPKAGQPKAANG